MRVFVAGGSGVVGRRLVTQHAKAKSELGWTLHYPSWRQGFKERLA
jgi:nucleoside-diphosphate-sugar epimerase